MASEAPELPAAAVKAIGRGIPADKVLMPEIDLTPKQRQFVRAMAEGASKRDAYLKAYDAQADSRSVGITACHIAAQPKIKSAIEQQRAVERLRYSQNPLDIRNFVVDSLQHEARTAQKPGDRLRALELLGKLADVAAFETRSVVTHQSGSDTTARLREKLARLGAIDVEARQVAEEGGDTPTPPPPPQTGRASGGPTRPNNPHQQSADSSDPQEGYPPEDGETVPRLQACPVARAHAIGRRAFGPFAPRAGGYQPQIPLSEGGSANTSISPPPFAARWLI